MSGLITQGGSAFKFETPGDTFEGVILDVTEMEDRDPSGNVKTWSDGTVKKVWVLAAQPKDGGENVSIWVRGNMVKAIRTASREAKVTALEGCTLKLRFSGLGEPTQKGYSAPKLFQARLTPGELPKASTALLDDEAPF